MEFLILSLENLVVDWKDKLTKHLFGSTKLCKPKTPPTFKFSFADQR